MRPDQVIAGHARAQHGVIAREQAIDAGLTEGGIRHRIEVGRWIALAPGIYAVATAPPTWERQVTAALLSRPGSVVACTSAAYLHRFTGYREGRPVVMANHDANARLRLGRVIRTADFDDIETGFVEGFPVTSVAETLWTISRSTPGHTLKSLVSQQVSMGKTDHESLWRVLERIDGSRQRGLTSFRAAVQSIDPSSHATAANALEAALYDLLSHPSIPSVSRQQRFLLEEPSRVDAYIPRWAVVVEADGRNWHTRQADFQRDRDRDNRLAARGILVVRLTYEDLIKRPDSCLRTLVEVGRNRRATNVV